MTACSLSLLRDRVQSTHAEPGGDFGSVGDSAADGRLLDGHRSARFDDLDRIFTSDAYIDYRATGGVDGRYPEVKAWLADVLPNFPAYSHMLGNFDVRIDVDTATSRTICFNPMVMGGDKQQVYFVGLWYIDDSSAQPRDGG